MEIRQAEHMGLVDDDRVRVGNVEARFDYVRGDQHINLAVDEPHHHLFKLCTFHLSVCNADACVGHKAKDNVRDLFNVAYSVVNKEDLTSATKLEADRIADNLFIEGVKFRRYRLTVRRRCHDDAEIACAHKRKVKCAGYGRGRQCKHIDIQLHLLELVFNPYTKLLLFIYYEQSQVFEHDITTNDTMCTDQDVDLTFPCFRENPFYVLCGTKT